MTARNKIVTMVMERTPLRYHDGHTPAPIVGTFAVLLSDDVHDMAYNFVNHHPIYKHLSSPKKHALLDVIIDNSVVMSDRGWRGWVTRIELAPREHGGYYSALGGMANACDEFFIVKDGLRDESYGSSMTRRASYEAVMANIDQVRVLTTTMDQDNGLDGYDHDRDMITVL